MVNDSQSAQDSKMAMSLQHLKKELTNKVDFLYAYKHRSFLQVDFNTLGIKFSHKVILSLWMNNDQAFSKSLKQQICSTFTKSKKK